MARTTRTPLGFLMPLGSSATTATVAPTIASVTVAKQSANNKRPTPIIIYPTGRRGLLARLDARPVLTLEITRYCIVTPESIVVPIVSCIFGFPLLALTVICCLRRRAKLARERARRRNCDLDRGELSVVRLSPVKARARAVSLARAARPLPSLELDTVLEERSDPEQTTLSQVEMTPDREVGAILFGAVGAMGTAAAAAAAACARDS